nr:MAG TPA: hypothetical protein [Crassvirales sp.]
MRLKSVTTTKIWRVVSILREIRMRTPFCYSTLIPLRCNPITLRRSCSALDSRLCTNLGHYNIVQMCL